MYDLNHGKLFMVMGWAYATYVTCDFRVVSMLSLVFSLKYDSIQCRLHLLFF